MLLIQEVPKLRPKVRPILSQEFAEEIINPRIFVVVSPNEIAICPRFHHTSMMKEKKILRIAYYWVSCYVCLIGYFMTD
jgi:hypothetical protein